MTTIQLPFISNLVRRIGLDLGTQTTRIWTDQAGLALSEPSCIAVDQRTRKVVAVGREAQTMEGRVADTIAVIHPIKDGVIYDAAMAKAMIKLFLHTVLKTPYFFRPIMMVSVPAQATQAQRQTVTKLMYGVGASEVYTMAQPLAAAIGAGVPIADASGTFMLHLGHGLVDAAVISLGSVVAKTSSDQGGAVIIDHLQQCIRDQVGLSISQAVAESLLHKVASLTDNGVRQMLVAGQDHVSNSPKEVTVTAQLLQGPLQAALTNYISLLKELLSAVPPELTVDVINKGMLLSGGLAQLHGLEAVLVAELGVAVTVVDQPDSLVVNGLGVGLENIELFKESLGYQK